MGSMLVTIKVLKMSDRFIDKLPIIIALKNNVTPRLTRLYNIAARNIMETARAIKGLSRAKLSRLQA